MTSKRWLKIIFSLLSVIICTVSLFNYIVDPYGLYKNNFLPNKPKDYEYMRLVKLLKLEELKPNSIVIGTSRAEIAIDPAHKYFKKPSYNLANAGLSLYEAKYYLEEAIKQENLNNVLLVLDWRMFNDVMKKIPDFETYFANRNIYKYLFNFDVLQDSIFTIENQDMKSFYNSNGVMTEEYMRALININGGHYNIMKIEEKKYYKNISSNNIYKDTGMSSFEDFRTILELCYRNKINLDIVFGPSHIRQWEAFDYYKNIETWYKWKKDVVLFVEKIADEQEKTPYRIMDFSIYHELTAETVPTNPKEEMKYHWEASHYKKELGDILLDRLLDISEYKDFGVELNSQNINKHIQNLREDRIKFINIDYYRKEVFYDY